MFRTLLLSICLLLCSSVVEAKEKLIPIDYIHSRDRQELLHILDETLLNRQLYIDARQHEIDVLKKQLKQASNQNERQMLYSSLYNRYGSYRTDSAFVYAKRAYDIALQYGSDIDKQHTSIDLAYCYCLSGLYHEGHNLMPRRSEVKSEVLLNYYIAQCSFLLWQSEFTTIPELKKDLLAQSMAYHDSILLTDPNPLHQLQERVQIPGMMSREDAIKQLESEIGSLPADEDYIRYMALMVGNIFMEQQQRDSALVFYTISAISDMRHGILEHASLQRVAALLFEKGDVEHAYHYMDCCLKDAQTSGARLRALELQNNLEIIMSAYNEQLLDKHRELRMVLIGIIALLVIVAAVSFRLNQLRKNLKRSSAQLQHAHEELQQSHQQLEDAMSQVSETNTQLEQAIRSLQESNRIKDSFVTQYMKQSRAGIGQLQAYQQMLQRLVATRNMDRLMETIRNTESLEPQLEEFYQSFDETFLSLYPDFLKQLNERLSPEERYAETLHLPNELRVFALMRLGVTDLEEIASFLRCASKTVLNYRSRLRQRAIIDKDQLDRWIIRGED